MKPAAHAEPSPAKIVALPLVAPAPSGMSLAASYRYCESLCRSKHNNYPIASFFARSTLRDHIYAAFAFARIADDYADEPMYEGQRARALDEWEGMLTSTYFRRVPDHPVFVALADTIKRYQLPITEFRQLLAGIRADLDTTSYATSDELVRHCKQAAAPLGHLFLYIAGYSQPHQLAFADDLACALAFTRMLQQLDADLARGRQYLPSEDLRHFGVTPADLLARRASPAADALIRFEVARARAWLMRARPLIDSVGPDIAVELALMWHGAGRMLTKIERAGSGVLTQPPRLTRLDKAIALGHAIAWRGSSLTPRAASLAKRFV